MQNNHISKLQWACRRGMLELDVLLGNFLSEAFPFLTPQDQRLFAEVLNHSDTQLFAWLMGYETPLDEDMVKITELIRCHARSRI